MNRAINFQTVSWFWDLHARQLLDLDPPYQRRSVWNQEYKDYFIDTVLNNYPAPAIFLYQEITPQGVSKYSVVDGKQRLSTLFEFAENEFPVSDKATLSRLRGKYFKELEVTEKQNFWKYQFAIEYVPLDDEGVINDIFNRINRNVSKLTPQELRHARFSGNFITVAEDLADWMNEVLPKNFPTIPAKARNQMKDIEFVAQLLLFLEEGVKSYRQEDLDIAFNDRDLIWEEQQEVKAEFEQAIDAIKQILELFSGVKNLSKSKLKNQADFYSLFAAIVELQRNQVWQVSEESVQRLEAFMQLVKDDKASQTEESLAYRAAMTTSLGSVATSKTQRRIEIVKSILSANKV